MKLTAIGSFVRDVKKAPQQIKDELEFVFQKIEAAKQLSEIPDLKKLSGFKTAYRIRIGDYRAGFVLEGDTVIFWRLLPRKEIYRFFP